MTRPMKPRASKAVFAVSPTWMECKNFFINEIFRVKPKLILIRLIRNSEGIGINNYIWFLSDGGYGGRNEYRRKNNTNFHIRKNLSPGYGLELIYKRKLLKDNCLSALLSA